MSTLLQDHIQSEANDRRSPRRRGVPTCWAEWLSWSSEHEDAALQLATEYHEEQHPHDALEETCDPRANPEANARRFLDFVAGKWRAEWAE